MSSPADAGPPAPTLVLLRHGETVGQSSIRLHGATDVALSSVGEQQAQRAAAALAGRHFARVLCSPLQRARRTAEIVLAALTAPPASLASAASCSIAAHTAAASSGGSTASITTIPSFRSRRVTVRRARTSSADSAPSRCTARSFRQISSSCAAVVWCASSSSAASVAGVATRVIARTFEYDRRPAPSAASIRGSAPSARATRTCSRAVPGSQPTRHASQLAHDAAPASSQ